MASIFTTSGSTVSISNTSAPPATFNAAGYAALTYSAINLTEDIGSFGDTSNEVTFDDIANGRTIKIKGQRNAGNMELVVAYDDTSASQALLKAAEEDDSTADWHFKVVFDNKLSAGGTNGIAYFSGKVMSNMIAAASADNVVRRNVTIAINTKLIIVAAT
jgi:hypothetical protein